MASHFKDMWKRTVRVTEKPLNDSTTSSLTISGLKSALHAVPPKDPNFGADPTIKTFYEGKYSGNGHYDWVETPPKQLNKKIAKAYDRVGIKIYKIKDASKPTISGRTPLKIHAIELQSPVLVNAIKDIVKAQDVFLEETETARFEQPFKALYFCYDEIMALGRRSDDDPVLQQHLRILFQVMGELFGGFMSKLHHLRASKLMSFELAWTYFPKGSIIYCGTSDCERLCRVVDTEYKIRPTRLSITCEEISFNGESFAWNTIGVDIPAFGGNLPITALPSFPFSFHEDQDGLKARLTKRGKKVLDYQQLTYREYSGMGIYQEGCKIEKHHITGRILIDFYGYCKHHEGLERTGNKRDDSQNDKNIQNPYGAQTPTVQNPDGDEKISDDTTYIKPLGEEEQEKNKAEMLKRQEDLIFVSPTLKGFSLKAKMWLNFYVDDIKPLHWNDEAYGHLVYPEEQKDLVLTFVENHQRMKKGGMDDVIMGKGQGLVILLSGPPGTGKTLTAEAVADKTRRPLYYLQAEDLGVNVAQLSVKIKKVFEMATEWNAVILLDEADVFMAERSPADIVRNELVSIFLRELEYFRGIIFLTTNLYSTIDAAFRSRVNIHLLFSSLPFSSRLVLWRKFLSRLPPSATVPNPLDHLSEEELKLLAKWELNGREIKNAIKTVRNWCECKRYEMSLVRLESGIMVTSPSAKKVEEEE